MVTIELTDAQAATLAAVLSKLLAATDTTDRPVSPARARLVAYPRRH